MTNTHNNNILVVEDSQVMSRILDKYLGQIFNCSILNAATVQCAKRHLVNREMDIIICDIMLSGDESGFDLLKYVRRDHRFCNIKFYVITVHENEAIKQQAYDLKCDGILFKPFNLAQFREMLSHE